MKPRNIGILGTGKMAEAILRSLVKIKDLNVFGLEANEPRKKYISDTYRLEFPDEKAFFEKADTILLAIKPQNLDSVIHNLETHWKIFLQKKDALLISIMAGIHSDILREKLRQNIDIIRIMPNTPSTIGKGIAAISFPESFSQASHKDAKSYLTSMLSGLGEIVEIDESQMNAVTALSGSGPAYVFSFIQGLIDAGVFTGLSRDIARKLVVETIIGSAQLLKESGEEPYPLQAQVTSPGGTTIHGLKVLQENGFEGILINAVEAAFNRAHDLEHHHH